MPFTKSWKRHETAAAYQVTRHHLDDLSYQPPAPQVAAQRAERFSGRTVSLPIHKEGRRFPKGEEDTVPHEKKLDQTITASTIRRRTWRCRSPRPVSFCLI